MCRGVEGDMKNQAFETVTWTGRGIRILDQSRLPQAEAYVELCSLPEVAEAIRSMQVRGAPLIGVVGAMGMALVAEKYVGESLGLKEELKKAYKTLINTRPTAVNLRWALDRMMDVYVKNQEISLDQVKSILLNEALRMKQEDLEANHAIGENGFELLPFGCRVMTICNAGALATCGYGTALGVVRRAFEAGRLGMVWVLETRPVLQGARLTVWELLKEGMPVTLVTDGMAGYLMQLGRVDAVITGADRVAANGDVANKIGTYSLAVLAYYHNIPFYVAAPTSTVDLKCATGADIPIEARDENEVRRIGGCFITLPQVEVFNPAFDVTPAGMISAIITEKGLLRPPFAESLRNVLVKE